MSPVMQKKTHRKYLPVNLLPGGFMEMDNGERITIIKISV